MKDIEVVVFQDKSWVRIKEYQKVKEENEQLKQGLKLYKKANKWHHTSKGEYPKECENVLCYCKGCGIKFYCVGNIIMGRWWATNKSEELRVIAWKEIVPPKFVVEE